MTTLEISVIAAESVLIALCFASLIAVSAVGGSAAKIVFCVISALSLISGVAFLIVREFISLPFSAFVLKVVAILAVALCAIAAAEFASMLVLLSRADIQVKVEKPPVQAPATYQAAVVNNVRKKDQIIHSQYKIVK